MLTRLDRRRLRQLERGLRATDPEWARRFTPRWRVRSTALTRYAVDAAAVTFVILGAMLASLPVVFVGILLASSGITSHVSSRRTR
jgi:hypothetical protein